MFGMICMVVCVWYDMYGVFVMCVCGVEGGGM